jgi:hypothetical protein
MCADLELEACLPDFEGKAAAGEQPVAAEFGAFPIAYVASTRPRIERFERETIDAATTRVTVVARVMDALFVIPRHRHPHRL